ncbi:unnamed protein product, partial [Mesorhabditis belari]|uniref:Amino acid transporter n=1 Tax=Mesorhabditis belari TaxID=2138241 RepID=A0AAF3E7R3_9BILA
MPRSNNKLGIFGAISYIAGSIIGAGIFVSPKTVLEHSGSIGLSLLCWLIGAVIALLTALVYIELATSIPINGSDFAYINFVKWKPLAFAFLWLSNLIQSSCVCAILFETFGSYMLESLSPFNFAFTQTSRKLLQQLLGFSLIWLLLWANFFSLKKYASKIQIVITISKLIAISTLIITGFYYMIFKVNQSHLSFDVLWKDSKSDPGSIVLSLYAGIWAYGGFDTLNFGTEDIEQKDIRKILPIAVIGGLSIAAITYLLVNIAYFIILTPQEILNSDVVASKFSEKTLGDLSYIMPVIIALLMISAINSDLFAWSRSLLAGSRAKMMPKFLSLIHEESGSPRVALFFHVSLAICVSFVGQIETLINWAMVASTMSSTTTVAALIFLRLKRIPVNPLAIKFPMLIHLTVFVISISLIIIPIVKDPSGTIVGFGLFLIFIAIYYLLSWKGNVLRKLNGFEDKFSLFLQVIFNIVHEKSELELSVN